MEIQTQLRTHTLVACSWTHCTHRQLGWNQLLSHFTTFRASIHGAPIRRCVFDVSRLLTWSSECKRPRGRPFVHFFQELTAMKGGDLEQRRGIPWYVSLSYARSIIRSAGGNKSSRKGTLFLRLKLNTSLILVSSYWIDRRSVINR